MSESINILDKDYLQWVEELCKRYRKSQIRAAVKVNTEMLRFYWELGQDIETKEASNKYGSGFYAALSRDLRHKDLAFSDSLVHKYFLIKKDSIKKEDSIITTTTYILKEEYQPKEITKYTDIHHYHSVQYEKTEYALRGNDTLSLSSSIQETKQLVAKYNALVKDYNALGNKYNLLVKENGALDKSYQASQMALGLIKRSYDIDYHVEDEGENQIKVSISAEKADSAFMLLPYYRKKLKFDNIKNVWIIK